MVPGEALAGKYVVERVLGRGGMGEVVVARHNLLGERVAIKHMLVDAAQDREAVQRFLNEARASIRIRSEHVVRVSDVDVLPTGQPYMVMEYLEGQDLEARLRQGSMAVAEAVGLLLQACEGVAEAHQLGIVHRDLKPANMFLTRRSDGSERLVLLDFGISKFTDAQQAGHGMTSTTGLMGSPSYMSPEQFQNPRDVDARTDVWALGVILFRMLTGRLPFEAESLPLLVVHVLQQPPAALRPLRPDVPPLLEGVVSQCLQKDRAQRFRSVAELALALAPFSSRDGERAIDRIRQMAAVSSASASGRVSAPAETRAVLPAAGPGDTRGVAAPLGHAPPPTREALRAFDGSAHGVSAVPEVSTASNFELSQRRDVTRPPEQATEQAGGKSKGWILPAVLGGLVVAIAATALLASGVLSSDAPRGPAAAKKSKHVTEPLDEPKASASAPATASAPPSATSSAVPGPTQKPKVTGPIVPPTGVPSGIPSAPPTVAPKPTTTVNDDI